MSQDGNKFWDKGLCSNKWLRQTLWLCDLHTNFWSAVSVFILSWPRLPTVAYSGLTRFQIFLISQSFNSKALYVCYKLWYILQRTNSYVYNEFWEMCVWSWWDENTDFFLIPCSTQFKNFTLSLGGHNLSTEFLPVQADWCCISQALSAWVSVPQFHTWRTLLQG